MSLSAHLWTLASQLRARPEAPEAQAWSTVVDDPTVGKVNLTGSLRREAPLNGSPADLLLVVVHGITGCAEASYALEAAAAASHLGISCLRVNLRGCDRRGGDYYHAGLGSDLRAALASPALADYERVVVLGYSLGGHIALRHAAEDPDPRLAAVAAVCSPLDLTVSVRAIDAPSCWAYRRFVLRNLRQIYAAVAATRPVPLPVEETRGLTLLREWDEAIIAPRWGFAGAEDYYARASVAPLLGGLRLPALLVAARQDPMVPGELLAPSAEAWDHVLDVRWVEEGGHLGFPADLDLGVGGAPRGLPGQVLGWLLEQAGG